MSRDDPEDDGYDDRRRRRPPPRSDRTLLWILGIVGCLGLAALLVCGGLAVVGFRAAGGMIAQIGVATGAAESFLGQLQAGDQAAAYQATSQGFKAGQTPEQFAKFVAQYPMLTGHTGRVAGAVNMFQMNGTNRFRIQYTLSGPNNATTCTLTLVEENGTWVVDTLTVP